MSNFVVKALVSPMSNIALMLGLVQVARLIDLKDPKIIMILRVAYGVSQLLSVLFLLYIRSRINKVADKKHFVEVEEPAKPFSNEEPKKTKMTVMQYDLNEVGKQLQQTLMSAGILMAIHAYFGYAQPLFLQSIMPWKTLLTVPLVRVHFWGCSAEGDLARPWVPQNPFGDLTKENKEDEAKAEAIEEKPARKNGKKEE